MNRDLGQQLPLPLELEYEEAGQLSGQHGEHSGTGGVTLPVPTVEWLKCSLSFVYWLDNCGWIYDAAARSWVQFRLWPAQMAVAATLAGAEVGAQGGAISPRSASCPYCFVILKARQLGLTWLVIGYALWLMIFQPAATVLLFSRRDDEAVQLLKFRLRGMYQRLPRWMQARAVETGNDHEFRLSNGSAALAFPTTGGRSYTATLAVVDEADHTDNLDRLLDAVKPTVDAGGSLILLSTADKATPGSAFKRIYAAARDGRNGYTPIFLPWHSRPDRSPAWYEAIRRDYLERDGTPDSLYGEYPATDVEALAGAQSDRRFAAEWLRRADGTQEETRILPESGFLIRSLHPAIPGLVVYVHPQPGRAYVIGADPAEGNPQSDESAASVVDADSGEQVAVLAGRFEPAVFAAHLATVSEFYRGAAVLVERNNHGHAVLLWLVEDGRVAGLLRGLDGKAGWLSSGRGKPVAFDAAADALREGATMVRDRVTLEQLMAIRGGSLAAPAGEHDDRALAHVLALAALRWCDCAVGSGSSVLIPPRPVLDARETAGW